MIGYNILYILSLKSIFAQIFNCRTLCGPSSAVGPCAQLHILHVGYCISGPKRKGVSSVDDLLNETGAFIHAAVNWVRWNKKLNKMRSKGNKTITKAPAVLTCQEYRIAGTWPSKWPDGARKACSDSSSRISECCRIWCPQQRDSRRGSAVASRRQLYQWSKTEGVSLMDDLLNEAGFFIQAVNRVI